MGTVPSGTMCEYLRYGRISPCHFVHSNSFLLFVLVSLSFFLDMEAAIKTVVTTFLSSSRGKENLDSKGFQKMVSKQLGGIMEVKNCNFFFLLFSNTLCFT